MPGLGRRIEYIPESVVVSMLRPFFPVVPIGHRANEAALPNEELANLNFEVVGMMGLCWPAVSISQARGTVDVLWRLGSSRFSSVLPGYLKFLGDPVAADAMADELAGILLRRAQRQFGDGLTETGLTPDQTAVTGSLFAAFSLLNGYQDREIHPTLTAVAQVYLDGGRSLPLRSES